MKKQKITQKIKNNLPQILLALTLAFFSTDLVLAASNNPALLPEAATSNLPDMGTVPQIAKWFYETARGLIGIVALVFGTFAMMRLVLARGDEGEETKAKRWLEYGLAGLVIFALAQPIAQIFGVEEGNMFLGQPDETATKINSMILIVISFIRYILGSVAVIALIYAGFTMIMNSSNDEMLEKQKKIAMWSVIALIIFMLSGEIVKTFYGTVGGNISGDSSQGNDTIAGLNNFLLGFLGMGATLALVIAAIFYTVSGENEAAKEKAKKIVIGTLVSVIVAYSSYTIVSEIVNTTGNISL